MKQVLFQVNALDIRICKTSKPLLNAHYSFARLDNNCADMFLQQQQGTEIVTGTVNYPHVVSYSKLLVWMQKNVNFVTMTAENFFKIG